MTLESEETVHTTTTVTFQDVDNQKHVDTSPSPHAATRPSPPGSAESTETSSLSCSSDSSLASDGQFVVRNMEVQRCMSDRVTWYSKSRDYWTQVPSTVDGMLGGYGSLTQADLCSSAQFLAKLCNLGGLGTELALDCGAGIGRVSQGLLLNVFEKVEMLDTCQEHLDNAREFMGDKMFARVSAQHCCGLQEFEPSPNTFYDLVWIQWVIIYLSDSDFINLLARLKRSLKKDGYIVIKDNVTKAGCELDADDSSVTRSDLQLKQIFKKAGLELLEETYQKGFPRELFKVKYYALR